MITDQFSQSLSLNFKISLPFIVFRTKIQPAFTINLREITNSHSIRTKFGGFRILQGAASSPRTDTSMTLDRAGLTPFWAWQRYLPESSGLVLDILRAPALGMLILEPSDLTIGESEAPVPPVLRKRRKKVTRGNEHPLLNVR